MHTSKPIFRWVPDNESDDAQDPSALTGTATFFADGHMLGKQRLASFAQAAAISSYIQRAAQIGVTAGLRRGRDLTNAELARIGVVEEDGR